MIPYKVHRLSIDLWLHGRLSFLAAHGRGRAAWVWTIYRSFTPQQERAEQKRVYPQAGQAPLEGQEAGWKASVI